ncbi:hypothetical protein [Daejeonella sp.]|uniref:hypothetical protein n=1 Tax=Daejeonella sp. TaxID=2805397 RepID=UPI0025C1AD1A|nr:hypothetical protein [Daejeonella sp.]
MLNNNSKTESLLYHIIIDNSKSMQVHQPELYTMLIRHLQNLNKSITEQGKLIHISCGYFNTENLGFEESYLPTLKFLKKSRNIELSGNSNIFDALAENLSYLNQKLESPEFKKVSKVYLALISDGHENKSSKTTSQELNNELIKFRENHGAEFIIMSGVFHNLDYDIKLTIPLMAQYAKDPLCIQNALSNLEKYICGDLI